MRRFPRTVLVIAGISLMLAPDLFAQAPSEPIGKGFEAFRLLRTRNVSDPNRRAPREPRGDESRRSGPPRSRTDSFNLLGTMVTEGKTLAFFGGTRSEYSRIIPVGESVGDFKLKSIGVGQVELERDGKTTTLIIGRTLQLEGTRAPEGPDIPEETVDPNTPPQPGASPTSPGSTSPSADPGSPGASGAPAPSNDKNEVLRKMMERRQKELSK